MSVIYLLLISLVNLTAILCYPVDYNETDVARAREALTLLHNLIEQNNFSSLLQQYNDDISQINVNSYQKLKTSTDKFSENIFIVGRISNKSNADISECLDNLNSFTVAELYQKYTEKCVNPTRALGENLVTLGDDKHKVVFQNKYDELVNFLDACVEGEDSDTRICAGVVESTLLEVERILPAVRANPLEIQRQMSRQIFGLSGCAQEQISVTSKRLKVEFNNMKTCVLDKINVA